MSKLILSASINNTASVVFSDLEASASLNGFNFSGKMLPTDTGDYVLNLDVTPIVKNVVVPLPPPNPIPTASIKDITSFTIKETISSPGSNEFPTSVVIPLKYGEAQFANDYFITDANNNLVPAQFEILNRHWSKDNSIRHLMVHIQPKLNVFTSASTGISSFSLKKGGTTISHPNNISVLDQTDKIIVSQQGFTNRNIIIQKNPFNIILPQGQLKYEFYNEFNSLVNSFNRNDIKIEIEEKGPIRSCIKISAPTLSASHGFAMRLYSFAGKPYIKLDYQLQNCDMTQTFSKPLIFEGVNISLPCVSTDKSIKVLTPVTTNPINQYGYLNAGNGWVAVKNFYQMWPNGISVESNNLKIEMFPTGSAQFNGTSISTSGKYWLDDLQSVYKEILIGLEAIDDASLLNIAKSFQFSPVPVVPSDWYEKTGVTLDLDGTFIANKLSVVDTRLPNYSVYSQQTTWPSLTQKLGWNYFGCDVGRKADPRNAGGWPYSADASSIGQGVPKFMLSGNPADYYYSDDWSKGELNAMNQWFIGYKYSTDFAKISPSSNPYDGWSWRKFDGAYGYNPAPGYPAPDGRQLCRPRDDQHGWFYHVEEAYNITGNPWIKDWYKGIAEFRKTRLNQKDPWPEMSGRAIGHSLSHALQAYRITGDTEILTLMSNYILTYIKPIVDPITGVLGTTEAPFQLGYLGHALISYLNEINNTDQNAVDILNLFVKFNLNYAQFGYYTTPPAKYATSDGSAMTFADIQAWVILKTNDVAALNQLREFINNGIGTGGQKPYINLLTWVGDFQGRIVNKLKNIRGGTL